MLPAMEGTEKELSRILSRVQRITGCNVSGYRTSTLIRRLRRRLKATGSGTYTDYLKYLAGHPREYAELLEDVFIHVTDFFRDEDVFRSIQMQVIPFLLSGKKERLKKIRVWSAGCDSGEEAYSLAICFREALGTRMASIPVTILATDVSEKAIEYAAEGCYTERELRNLPPPYLEKYFTREGERYRVSDGLKDLVRFRVHNLADAPPLRGVDLLVCRNVLIFFSEKMQKTVFRHLLKAINKGGVIVLGKAESVIPELHGHFEALNQPANIFERVK